MLAQALHICAVFWQSHLKDSTYSPGSWDSGTSTWSPNTHLSPSIILGGLIIVHCDPSGVVYLGKILFELNPPTLLKSWYNQLVVPDSFLLCPLIRVKISSRTCGNLCIKLGKYWFISLSCERHPCVVVEPLFVSGKVQVSPTEAFLIHFGILCVHWRHLAESVGISTCEITKELLHRLSTSVIHHLSKWSELIFGY